MAADGDEVDKKRLPPFWRESRLALERRDAAFEFSTEGSDFRLDGLHPHPISDRSPVDSFRFAATSTEIASSIWRIFASASLMGEKCTRC
jgi:hypothetical protein